jgi:acetoin utilization protein AcuC
MPGQPRFIGSEIYRRSRYGGKHPLAIPRVSAVIDLVRALGWLPDEIYIDSPIATPAQLARFHDPDYIRLVQDAERLQAVPPGAEARHGLGVNGNPIFGEIFSRPATACGATLKAVELLAAGGVVHSPAGGTHHGRRDAASGFCYFNDPALGLLAFRDAGIEPLVYLDIDAHHGDGVEEAFADDPRVVTISVHEAGRWPHTGLSCDPHRGIYNFPVPPGFNDTEFAAILDEAVLPLIERMRPAAIMVQCGADALLEDPLSKLALSNRAYWRAIAAMKPLAPRLLVLGGGGYNPWSVARCWAGIWATLNGIEIPERLPSAAESVLRGLAWGRTPREPIEAWLTTLADAPRPGPVRTEIRELIAGAHNRV